MNEHWTARFSRPIVFIIITLIGMGAYLAFTIPVAVFPSTDFPRIVVGVDNGVAPHRSDASDRHPAHRRGYEQRARPRNRPLEHQPRLGRNQPLLRLERQHVPDPRIRQRRSGARPAHPPLHGQIHRQPPDIRRFPHPRLQPHLRYAPADRRSGNWPTTPSNRASTASTACRW